MSRAAAAAAFSPPAYSSLPGWLMPPWTGDDGYPPAAHVPDYLARYERCYDLPVRRPVRVDSVSRVDDDPRGRLLVHTDRGTWASRVVISATGTFSRPFIQFVRRRRPNSAVGRSRDRRPAGPCRRHRVRRAHHAVPAEPPSPAAFADDAGAVRAIGDEVRVTPDNLPRGLVIRVASA